MNFWSSFTSLCYAAALAVVSLYPSGARVPGGGDTLMTSNVQNFLHLPAYTGLALLLFAHPAYRSGTRLAVVVGVSCACVLYGALLEWLQSYVPGRTASLTDVLTNTTGVVLGLCVWGFFGTRAGASKRPAVRSQLPEPSDREPDCPGPSRF